MPLDRAVMQDMVFIKRDFDIWSTIFSGQTGRLTRVVAGQAANQVGVTEAILKNMDGKFDAVSCTGYFGLSNIPGKIDTPKYQGAIEAAKKHVREADAR